MKKIILMLCFLVCFIFSKAQINTFEKYITGYGTFEITDILEHKGQYYMLCNHSSDTWDQQYSFLLRMNKNSDSVSYFGINISFHYVLRDFSKGLSGGLCFVGGIDSLESNFNFSQDALFVETDYEGNISNVKSYKMSSMNDFYNVVVDDSCYFASGHRYVSNYNMDLQVVRIDSTGELKDSMSLDFRNLDAVTSMNFGGDNILISGTILGGKNDGYLSMLTKNLDTLFFKKFNVSYDHHNFPIRLWYSYSSKFTVDSFILFPCVFILFNPNDTNDLSAYEHSGLIRTDKNGNFKSLDIYYLDCRYDRPLDIFESGDGNYIIAGTINFAHRGSASPGLNGDFYLMKVDTLGNILWFKRYGDSNYQEMKSAIQTSDGGFLLAGYSITDYPTQRRTGYVVKTDSIGNVILGLNQNKIQETKLYPNPASNSITIQSSIKYNNYTIYNTLGQKIQSGLIDNNTINIKDLFSGIYTLHLKNETYSAQQKFIKE